MAANGTPQSYLNQQRRSSAPDNYRDRSMEQQNTSSGNPYGYVPPQNSISQYPSNRYIPPMWSQAAGGWMQTPTTYSLPSAYTPNAGGGLPTGPLTMSPQTMGQLPMWSNSFGQQQAGQPLQLQSQGGLPTRTGYTLPYSQSPQDTYMHIPHDRNQSNLMYSAPQFSQQQSGSGSALSNYYNALQQALGSGAGGGAPQYSGQIQDLQALQNQNVGGNSAGLASRGYIAPQYMQAQPFQPQGAAPSTGRMLAAQGPQDISGNPGMFRRGAYV